MTHDTFANLDVMPSTDQVDTTLSRVSDIATELGVESIANEAEQERRRVAEARFFVACIGQFKRGKSTLLNALVNMPIVPTGVVPVTSVITVLRHGESPHALVQFLSGKVEPWPLDDIAAIVDERRNPQNEKGVAIVEVFVPSSILLNGLCLVDTPGLGSVFAENTAVTRRFIPHVDVALVVLGVDPPITGEELDLIEQIGQEAEHILVVLNKADQASEAQRNEVNHFTVGVIERRLGRSTGLALEVSALERINQGEPTRDWTALECELRELADNKRTTLVAGAAQRAIGRLTRRLGAEIREHEIALTRPLAETRKRVEALRADLTDIDRTLRDLRVLLQSAEDELRPHFERQRTAFVERAGSDVQQTLERWIADNSERLARRSLRSAAYAEARHVVEHVVEEWSARLEPDVAALYEQTTARFLQLASDYVARLTAHAGLDTDDADISEDTSFARREFYFTSLMHLTAGSPRTWLIDFFAPKAWRTQDITRGAIAYAAHLLESNSHRIENDFRERTSESRRRLERAITARLTDTLVSAERALAAAMDQARLGEQHGAERLQRLRSFREALGVTGRVA